MAIEPGSLLAPEGPVEPELFPGEYESGNLALTARLSSYVSQGVTKVAGLTFSEDADEQAAKIDEATRAYALYLAFRAAYTLALTRPAEEDSLTEVVGRTEYARDQRDALKELYQDYLSEYQLIVADVITTSASSQGLPSFQSTNEYDW